MRITCPICGLRDMREFHYLGSAKLLDRPQAQDVSTPANAVDQAAFHDYLHIRENPEGANPELWSHEYGCRAWLHVLRSTKSHEIYEIKLASEVK